MILTLLIIPVSYVIHLMASTVVHYRREYRISKLTLAERRGALRDLTTNICEGLQDVDYWLDYGTLLGVIRGGDVLAWDSDVDVSVPRATLDEAFDHLKKNLPARYEVVRCAVGRPCHTIQEAWWSPWWQFHRYTGWYRLLARDTRTGLNCDVMRVTSPSESVIHQNLAMPGYKVERGVIFPLQYRKLADLDVKVPHQPEVLLETTYGPDWRTPKPPFWYESGTQG